MSSFIEVVEAVNELEAKTDITNDKLDTVIALLQVNGSRPIASILAQEFYNRQDLDGGAGSGDTTSDVPAPNNSIYGTVGGWAFLESDPLFPLILESVHENPRFEFPAIRITFQQYLDTL